MLTMVVATMVIVTGVALFFDSDLKSHWNIIGGIGHIIAGTIILGTGYLIHSGVVPRFT